MITTVKDCVFWTLYLIFCHLSVLIHSKIQLICTMYSHRLLLYGAEVKAHAMGLKHRQTPQNNLNGTKYIYITSVHGLAYLTYCSFTVCMFCFVFFINAIWTV